MRGYIEHIRLYPISRKIRNSIHLQDNVFGQIIIVGSSLEELLPCRFQKWPQYETSVPWGILLYVRKGGLGPFNTIGILDGGMGARGLS